MIKDGVEAHMAIVDTTVVRLVKSFALRDEHRWLDSFGGPSAMAHLCWGFAEVSVSEG